MRKLRAAERFLGLLLLVLMSTSATAQSGPSGSQLGSSTKRERIQVPDYVDEDEARPGLELPDLDSLPSAKRFELSGGFEARGFRIVGSTVFSDLELAEAVAPFLDQVLYAESMPALTDTLTRLYIDAGYISSGAIIPDQTVEEGILEIHIIEGVVGSLEITKSGRLRRQWIEPRMRAGLTGPLQLSKLDESLRLLQSDPRVARVDAVLIPSSTLGESLVRLEIEEANPWTMDLRAANDLAPALGGSRALANVVHRNVTGFGDTFYGTVSGARGLFEIDLGYAIPFTPWRTEFQVFGNITKGEVVEGDFEFANFRNDLESYGIALTQPVWYTLEDEVRLTFEVERRTSRLKFLDGLDLDLETARGSDSQIRLFLLRLHADWVHRGVDEVFSIGLRTTIGLDTWNATSPNETSSPSYPAPDGPTLADAEFTSWLLQMQYARRFETFLGDGEFVTRGDLQLATGSLFALESFSMGGASTVRGYNENAVVTDNGVLASIEFRLPLLPASLRPHELRVAPFLDSGYAWDDGEQYASRFDQFYMSVGLGLLYRFAERFEMKGYWGQPFFHTASRNDDRLQNAGFHLEATVSVF
jgi:hemolysin activation/secretion protein